jgi:transposase
MQPGARFIAWHKYVLVTAAGRMFDYGNYERKFTLEFKTEAAHRVIDTGRTIAEVSAELSVMDSSLARWVRDERHRMDTVVGDSDEPLSAERTELLRLRRQVAEQDKDLAFLGKAAAYFVSNPPKRRD